MIRILVLAITVLQLLSVNSIASIQEVGGHLIDDFYSISLNDMTPDGRYILLARHGGNNLSLNELHLYDRQNDTYELITTGQEDGFYSNYGYKPAQISDDANKVVYFAGSNIAIHDRALGHTVYHPIPRLRPDYYRFESDANARYIAYSHLVQTAYNNYDIQARLFDSESGLDILISKDLNNLIYYPVDEGNVNCISDNGRYVVLTSRSELTLGDIEIYGDTYIYDVLADNITRILEFPGDEEAFYPMPVMGISDDGKELLIAENHSSSGPAPAPTPARIFKYNVQNQTYTEDVTFSTSGIMADHDSNNPKTSLDSRYVVFESKATNLVEGDTNELQDIFIRDRVAQLTQRINIDNDGKEADGWSQKPFISDNGRVIAFESVASNLTTTTSFSGYRIYVVDWQPFTVTKAEYNSKKQTLSVSADSEFGPNNTMVLEGYGQMTYNRFWNISVSNVSENPGSVTVTGVEGSITVPTTIK